ncbi:MAG TPA: DJ-1 family glyoxalase III [Oligoflexus sp.]|uniref:DJ-1 family glyoxalase III n=1 Tax=Oligoflexus sp. TaxID=1971216 RepID=UPI002D5EB386|nr:DJ-1 family glyoxalase III [Oligoflexus sp.]HYX37439.1 DJ-1 family glyoxalase III [Oligoflexus sp.]
MSQVAVLLADGFEEIEAITIVDVLRRADVQVRTLALKDKTVRGAHGISVQADGLLEQDHGQNWDLVVLPGGQPGANTLRDDPRVASLIERQLGQNRKVAAICAAPIALGAHGMLKGRHATCYPGFEDQLRDAKLSVDAVVVDKEITTSRGPGTAMSFALNLVEQLKGKQQADSVRKGMLL